MYGGPAEVYMLCVLRILIRSPTRSLWRNVMPRQRATASSNCATVPSAAATCHRRAFPIRVVMVLVLVQVQVLVLVLVLVPWQP